MRLASPQTSDCQSAVTMSQLKTFPLKSTPTSCEPSGLNARSAIPSEGPRSGSPTDWPVAESHRRTTASAPPDARYLPSGLKASAEMVL